MLGLPIMWDSLGVLEDSVKSGRPGAESLDRDGFFAYLDSHPAESKTYDEGMTAMTLRRIARIVPHYDSSVFTSIADVGGGRGHLLRAVLDRAPSAKGILFDRPGARHRRQRRAHLAATRELPERPVTSGRLLPPVQHRP